MKTARGVLILTGILFLVMGLAFMGASFGVRETLDALADGGICVQGEFISVGKGDTWIRYQAEGKTYEIRSSTYSSDMHVGDPVTVWYQPGNPGRGRMDHWAVWGVFMIVGGVFSLLGLGFLIAVLPKALMKRSLMMNGTPVTAQITDISQNMLVAINHRHPYVVHAVLIHPYTGQEMKVKSGFLMQDPSSRLSDGTVEVLVDPMRDNRYYMKIEE
ncbi:MAG: DUF3592 domain-containing protein [Clostridia bacterium]|nr:DUF3592 domain-containing protein [Clostridia bacterium]